MNYEWNLDEIFVIFKEIDKRYGKIKQSTNIDWRRVIPKAFQKRKSQQECSEFYETLLMHVSSRN